MTCQLLPTAQDNYPWYLAQRLALEEQVINEGGKKE